LQKGVAISAWNAIARL